MENIDNMAGNSLEALSRDNLTAKGKKKLAREIICSAASLSCLIAGLIISKIIPEQTVVPALLYTVGALIEGVPVFIAAIKGIFSKNLTNAMEILVAIAILACFFSRDLILAVLIPMILNIAHFLEERSIIGGRDVIDGLRKMQQSTAILLDGEYETTVDAKSLKIGQKIVIKPGCGIPIDGIVLHGETNIDQKSLTGEPQPARAAAGDMVYAGTVNIDGRIIVEVGKEYIDTSFSKILALLEKSENISVPESRLIDRFMRYYIPFVLAVAAAVALISADISKAIAILVVSCPCGQMLVSSAPMIAALSAATKRGILIKNSKFIEELTEIDTVVFDKTGTVTVGSMSLTEAVCFGDVKKAKLLETAAAVAVSSNHPVSRAVLASVVDTQIDRDYDVREIPGKGIIGVSPDGTHRICFGRRDWINSDVCVIPECFCDYANGTISYVTLDGLLLGALCFGDTARPDAKSSILQLREAGVTQTVMLTGDREPAARAICDETDIDVLYAQLLPQDKLDHIRKLKNNHCVLAVGDGINDALALREADVGIAMGSMGSDLAIQSADIALMNNNLTNIPFAVRLAQRTRKTVYQNLALSLCISAVMICLSAFGVISALAGSVLHNLGAFAVLINSSRILRIK